MKSSGNRDRAREPFFLKKKYQGNDTVSVLCDNSLTNPINQESILYQDESLQTLWHRGKMTCIIPYKYADRNINNCSNNKFIRQRMNAFKKCLSEIIKSDNSMDNLERGLENGLFEESISNPFISIKDISKTLSGWDDHGIHYLLSKINNQRSDYLLPRGNFQLPARSFIHIHACESCNDKLFNNFSIYTASICLTDSIDIESYHNNNNTLLLQEKGLIPCLESSRHCCISSDSINDKDLKCIDQCSHEEREFDNKMECSEQYFKRVVYSYNSCGLQFKFPDNNTNTNKKRRKCGKPKLKKPILNPFMKVVVYGTDPCALNFPVELGVTELNTEDRNINDDKMKEKSFSADLLGDICHDSNVLSDNYNPSLNFDNSNEKAFIQKINSNDKIFFNLKGDLDNSSNTSDEKYYTDVTTDDPSFKTSMNNENMDVSPSSGYGSDKSMPDSKIRFSQIQPYCDNRLVPVSSNAQVPSLNSLLNFDEYNNMLFPQLSTCLENSYQSDYPSREDLLEFSAYENSSQGQDPENSVPSWKSKRSRRKRRTKFNSKFPSFMKARLFTFSDDSEILLNKPPTKLNFSKSRAKLLEPIELPFIVHGCLYIIIFVFFVISILLIQDTLQLAMTTDPLSSMPRDNYFEWSNYHKI